MAVSCDHPVSDNQWHILTIKRRAKELEAHVDNCRPATGLLTRRVCVKSFRGFLTLSVPYVRR